MHLSASVSASFIFNNQASIVVKGDPFIPHETISSTCGCEQGANNPPEAIPSWIEAIGSPGSDMSLSGGVHEGGYRDNNEWFLSKWDLNEPVRSAEPRGGPALRCLCELARKPFGYGGHLRHCITPAWPLCSL